MRNIKTAFKGQEIEVLVEYSLSIYGDNTGIVYCHIEGINIPIEIETLHYEAENTEVKQFLKDNFPEYFL